MALETGTYVSDLVPTNPTSGDPKAQGDDHLRLIKSTLQSTFPDASAPIYGLRSGTATASTSGTLIDFTGIPSWAKRVTFSYAGLSSSGTSPYILQIGDSGGIETTGYNSVGVLAVDATATTGVSSTAGFVILPVPAAGSAAHGTAVLTLLDSATNHWVCSISGALTNVVVGITGGGSKVLTAPLDRVRLTTVGGTDNFDAGVVNILYE